MRFAIKKVLKILTLPFLLIGCNGKGEEPAEVNLYTDWYNELETEFTITTQKQLIGFAELVNDGNSFISKTIKLGANIALNDTANWLDWANNPPDNKWVPIGNLSKRFHGTFDGNGFAISGIYINNSDDNQGLFGYITYSGEIKNLGVVASHIKGNDNVGGLAGISGKNINNNYFSGKVTGKVNVGGLAGRCYRKISNSYSNSEVTGESNVGGLVGVYGTFTPPVTGDVRPTYIGGDITNSYSTGAVAGQNYVGGLVGVNNDGNITNSYSAGKVTGQNYVGGLIGVSTRMDDRLDFIGNIANSYYDKEESEQSDEGKGEGKTTEDMRLKATYVGWDFDEIWDINEAVNNGYPYLAAP